MVDQVLEGYELVHRGQPQLEPRLHGRVQARTLDAVDQACVKERCEESQHWLADRDGPVVAVFCRVSSFVMGMTKLVLAAGATTPVLTQQLNSAAIAGWKALGGGSSGLGPSPGHGRAAPPVTQCCWQPSRCS